MSTKNGVWHDPELDPPRASDDWVRVLVVKQNKSGEKKLEIASYLEEVGWVTSNGKGTVLYWMPLPAIPKN